VPLPDRLKNGKVRRKRKTAAAKTTKTTKRSKTAVAAK